MSLPYISLSSIFQSCPFQVPDHPAKLVTTVRESVCNYTSGHFSFQQSEHEVHCSKFCPLEGYPFQIFFKDVP